MGEWKKLTLENIYNDKDTKSLTKTFGIHRNLNFEILKGAIQVEPYLLSAKVKVEGNKCFVELRFRGVCAETSPQDFLVFYERKLLNIFNHESEIQSEKINCFYKPVEGSHMLIFSFNLKEEHRRVTYQFDWLVNSTGYLQVIKNDLNDFFVKHCIEFARHERLLLSKTIRNFIYRFNIKKAFYKIENGYVNIRFNTNNVE